MRGRQTRTWKGVTSNARQRVMALMTGVKGESGMG